MGILVFSLNLSNLWLGLVQGPHSPTMDQQFNFEFHFKSVFNLEFQPKFGIKLGFPILMEINLGECMACGLESRKGS